VEQFDQACLDVEAYRRSQQQASQQAEEANHE
jgi:hypothetical protein